MSDMVCPECKYKYAMCDSYYKSNELYISCERCGFYYGRTAKTNIPKGKRMYKKLKELLKKKEYDKAWKVAGIRFKGFSKEKGDYTEKDLTQKERIERIKQMIKDIKLSKFDYFYAKDKKGRIKYKEVTKKPKGAYRIMFNGGGSSGHYTNNNFIKDLKEEIEKGKIKNGYNEKPTSATYTFKKKGEWYIIDLVTNKETKFSKSQTASRYGGKENGNN